MPKKTIITPFILFGEEAWILKRYEKIASLIKGDRVLDLGCGNGRLKKVINIEMHGIDIDPKKTELCQKLGYASVLCADVEESALPFPDEYFSTVTCLDILEHLYDPVEILLEINRVLKDEGRIIISCPNISFFLFRILMLFGIFSDVQLPQRIVNSHIRFFTIRRLKNILCLCGFKTKMVYGTTNLPWPGIIAKPFDFLARIYPRLFAYAFVLMAEKVKPSSKDSKDLLFLKDKSIIKQFIKTIQWG